MNQRIGFQIWSFKGLFGARSAIWALVSKGHLDMTQALGYWLHRINKDLFSDALRLESAKLNSRVFGFGGHGVD